MSSDSEFDSPDNFVHVLPATYPWTNDPTFGVIHPLGCKACRHYMSHMVDARHTFDPSFESAIKERDNGTNARFLDGFREGQRVQRGHDHERIGRYRSERNAALELSAQYNADVLRLQAELSETRDRLLALQVAFDEIIHVDSPFISEALDDSANALHFVELQTMLLGSSTTHRATSYQQYHPSTSSISTSVDGRFENSNSFSDSFIPAPSEPLDSWRSPETFHDGDLHDLLSDHDTEISSESSFSESSGSLDSSPLSTSSDGLPDVKSHSNSEINSFSELGRLKLMMAEAHVAGNSKQLVEIRALCSCAHRTPRRQRTDVQKFLLNTWRSPSSSPELHDKAETALLGDLFSREIFVDASGTGIGFVNPRGMWLAWKLKSGWKGDGRDIIWAEMVAVELGLRAMVAAGSRSTHITVRSDNSSVVRALHSKSSRNVQENSILQEILILCRAHDIEITPKWISTKENPADGPSRGICPPKSLIFHPSPTLPVHLIKYVKESGV